MNRKSLLFLCLILCLFTPTASPRPVTAEGTDIFVSADPGVGADCSQANPCSPSQALAIANDGDRLYFRAGTYTGTTDPLLTIERGLSLYGGWVGNPLGDVILDPQSFETKIDGEGSRGLLIVNPTTGDHSVLIKGFTFTRGEGKLNSSYGYIGGAIMVQNGAVLIEDNQFLDNTAGDYGGAIFIVPNDDVTIQNNVFENNGATYRGGAIYVSYSSVENPSIVIEGNEFLSNSSSDGDVISVDRKPVFFNGNWIKDSTGPAALSIASDEDEENPTPHSVFSNNMIINSIRAIYLMHPATGSHRVWNNTIVSSTYAISGTHSTMIEITNNIIVQSNVSISLDGIATPTGSHNLFYNNTSDPETLDDPLMDTPPMFVDPASDDYHLSKYSEAIDAGTTVDLWVDFDGDERPSGSGYDIGADEVMTTLYLFLPLIRR